MKIPITDDDKEIKNQSGHSTEEMNDTENNTDISEKENLDNDNADTEEKSNDELIEEYKEQLQRIQAEFINYRRRIEKERKKDFYTAKGTLILSLLPVLDDFDRLFQHYKGKKQCNLDEIEMLHATMKKILTEQKLSELEDENCEFDPNYHEAVGVVETSEENDDKVMEVIQKGYKFGDTLLRPSRVRVGKYNPKNDEAKKDSD